MADDLEKTEVSCDENEKGTTPFFCAGRYGTKVKH